MTITVPVLSQRDLARIAELQKQAQRVYDLNRPSILRNIALAQEALDKQMPMIQKIMASLPNIKFVEIGTARSNYTEESELKPTESSKEPELAVGSKGALSYGELFLAPLNKKTSRHAKLLCVLYNNRGRLLSYEEIADEIGVIDITQAFKDLKKVLKRHNLRLDYERPRGQGIKLNSIEDI